MGIKIPFESSIFYENSYRKITPFRAFLPDFIADEAIFCAETWNLHLSAFTLQYQIVPSTPIITGNCVLRKHERDRDEWNVSGSLSSDSAIVKKFR